ncbi:MAG: hypothetical protein ACKO37_06150 [Vampirovibrionales bacterium]
MMMFSAAASSSSASQVKASSPQGLPKMVEFTLHDPEQKGRSLGVLPAKRVLPPLPTSPEGLLSWSVVEILQQWPHLEADLKQLGLPTQGYRAASLETLRATLMVHQLDPQTIAKKLFKRLP